MASAFSPIRPVDAGPAKGVVSPVSGIRLGLLDRPSPARAAAASTMVHLLSMGFGGSAGNNSGVYKLPLPPRHTSLGTTRKRSTPIYSRKDKSLGLLCERFLERYAQPGNHTLSLDDATNALGTERRRIYDIINVLESINIVSRQGHNNYVWKGLEGVPQWLEKLQEDIRRKAKANEAPRGGGDSPCSSTSDDTDTTDSNSPTIATPNKTASDRAANTNTKKSSQRVYVAGKMRREKSLSILSRKFIQMFLEGKMLRGEDVISLETVAKTVLAATAKGMVEDGPKVKTRVRRLYDIANVLASVGLIKKIRVLDENEASKAAFRWTGAVSPRFLEGNQKRGTTPSSPDEASHVKKVQQKEQVEKTPNGAKAKFCYTASEQTFSNQLQHGVPQTPPNNYPAYLLVDVMQNREKMGSAHPTDDDIMRKVALTSVTCPEGRALPLDSLPNPFSMLEYHQKKLKAFMLRYCSQWHSWQQMATECRSNGLPTPPPITCKGALKSPVPMRHAKPNRSMELLRRDVSPGLDPALVPLGATPPVAVKPKVVFPTSSTNNVFTTSNKARKFCTKPVQQWRAPNPVHFNRRENCENAVTSKPYKRPRSMPNLRLCSGDAFGVLGRPTTGIMNELSPSRRRRIANPNLLNNLSPSRWGNNN